MFAVIFEVLPSESGYQRYLDLAAALRPRLETIDGFLSIERFRSLSDAGWILSLSRWRDEAALVQWRGHGEHHAAQSEGRQSIFSDYRIRVARIGDCADSVLPLVGMCDGADDFQTDTGKRYESLTTPGKRILLRDFGSNAEALSWRPSAPQAMCGEVVRDYGMFERRQAPQRFPAAARHAEERT
ncbi:antibiotic biosynthesis monooxygenase [Noviherbaspirillum cavernae]|uniref:Antibiotic biosynthesis monooxygenase n=1 Tax=Noviherbaspirillum cavernae TaxID=2320862 RepID=A0A418X6X4_9BURK|nr:antibiotic biosynthesis monooxygenase [Noviherbaspirillum cavernae]RJG08146.1 antibiotic biosynthesis monooxygenase [Noviherbaspirillum cavernae]